MIERPFPRAVDMETERRRTAGRRALRHAGEAVDLLRAAVKAWRESELQPELVLDLKLANAAAEIENAVRGAKETAGC